ncbi:MAG: hypothetical protein AB1403_16395, partial [Candidatus Riflebacteria bacterium]
MQIFFLGLSWRRPGLKKKHCGINIASENGGLYGFIAISCRAYIRIGTMPQEKSYQGKIVVFGR